MFRAIFCALFVIFLFGFVSYVLYMPLAQGFGNLAWTPSNTFLSIIMLALPVILIIILALALHLRREQ